MESRAKALRSGFWQDFRAEDFEHVDSERTVALLPVGAIEQHGPHLPLATDALINEGIVRAALPLVAPPAVLLVLPALAVGNSPEHARFRGTLTIKDTTVADGWTDIGRSVARAGVRKLVIVNSHGGQRSLVDLVALRLRAELSMLVVRANYFALGVPPGLFDSPELAHDIHGGEIETSLMLHLAPELVRRDRLENFSGLPQRLAQTNRVLGAEKPVGIGWLAEDLHPAGVCGDASRADAAKGARYLAHVAERLAALVAETAAAPLSILR